MQVTILTVVASDGMGTVQMVAVGGEENSQVGLGTQMGGDGTSG